MQVSFLHVCSAFVTWVDCGISLGGWQNPLVSVFQAIFLKQRESTGAEETSGGKVGRTQQLVLWTNWVRGHDGMEGQDAPSLPPPPC